jgi:hypothetical protein
MSTKEPNGGDQSRSTADKDVVLPNLKDDPYHELMLGNDIGEGFPGEDAPTSDVPLRLPDGREIPGDSGPF